MINLSAVPYLLKLDGDITGESYTGNFEFKRLLTHRDRINRDAARRNLLGEKPNEASRDAVIRAEMLAHLSVSITESPKFWKESNNGLDLYDDNVVINLYEKAVEIQSEEIKKVVAEGETAKKELKNRKKDDKDE